MSDATPTHDTPAIPAAPDAPVEARDAAQASLADALQASFGVLKAVMILAVVLYVFSGLYRVGSQEAAVQLVLGDIVGDGEDAIRGSGWHLGWPYPLGSVIKVPTTQQQLSVHRAFMFELNQQNQALEYDQMTGGALNPERDGSLITGDADLVHAVFNVTYTITDPADYIRTVGEAVTDPDGTTGVSDRLEQILRAVTQEAIVTAAARTRSTDFIAGRANTDLARSIAQRVLDGLNTGVTLDQIVVQAPTMPISVRDAYASVSQAEAQRNADINEAQTRRRELLGQAGGPASLPLPGGSAGPLVGLIRAYELASTTGETDEADRLRDYIDRVFRTGGRALNEPDVAAATGVRPGELEGLDVQVGGDAAAVISAAQTDRTASVQRVRVEAESFRELLPQYRKNPELFRRLLVEGVRAEVFGPGGDIETFVTPGGPLMLELNRDPDVTRQRELQRREQVEAAQGL